MAGVDVTEPILAARRLTKIVPNGRSTLTILHDIDLEVMPGEVLGIVGASGSGKSTLLALLAGLDRPSSGSVVLDQVDLASLDEDGRAAVRSRLVGFVFQSFQLIGSLTALENVMLPLELQGQLPIGEIRERAAALLDRVGLSSRLQHSPRLLSGGEQQRVALARAFVVEPRILFADEPTGNLDAATGSEVIAMLLALNRERGTTLVIVTHDEAVAGRCDRVVRIAAGALAAGSLS
jgi:putative ABC transport system ATP-binding protein